MYKLLNIIALCLFVNCVSGRLYVMEDREHETPGDSGPLSVNCMRCIWNALDKKRGVECREDRCGPYDLTLQYWELAYDESNATEYRECTKHVWCAYRTVQKYMSRYLEQCVDVSEARPVCETALALHLHGHKHCSRALTEYEHNKMRDCRDSYVWSWLDMEHHTTKARFYD